MSNLSISSTATIGKRLSTLNHDIWCSCFVLQSLAVPQYLILRRSLPRLVQFTCVINELQMVILLAFGYRSEWCPPLPTVQYTPGKFMYVLQSDI
jgi:hypothetical protein